MTLILPVARLALEVGIRPNENKPAFETVRSKNAKIRKLKIQPRRRKTDPNSPLPTPHNQGESEWDKGILIFIIFINLLLSYINKRECTLKKIFFENTTANGQLNAEVSEYTKTKYVRYFYAYLPGYNRIPHKEFKEDMPCFPCFTQIFTWPSLHDLTKTAKKIGTHQCRQKYNEHWPLWTEKRSTSCKFFKKQNFCKT